MISNNNTPTNDNIYQQDHVVKIPYIELDRSASNNHSTAFSGRFFVYIAPLMSTLMIVLLCMDKENILLNANTCLLILIAGIVSLILAYVLVSTILRENF
jgi:hypothetical protein